MRPLSQHEEANRQTVLQFVGDVALLMPTPTGMEKSIMDAILPLRSLLKSRGIHDYSSQRQGPEHKVIIDATLWTDDKATASRASLYRPVTKEGDPRIWFTGLPSFANANDILAIFVRNHALAVINLTQSSIARAIAQGRKPPVLDFLADVQAAVESVATELLKKLKAIAAVGFVPAVCNGDTAIGRTLETRLGIQQNPKKTPDYKGIELKSFRGQSVVGRRENRATLFAQVPDWKLSKCKSSAEILYAAGYVRGDVVKLYCTLSTIVANSQGLRLRLDGRAEQLVEYSVNNRVGDMAVWELRKLHERLLEKHRETFWIKADSKRIDGREYFSFNAVRHTKSPSLAQFDELLGEGKITLDHLIKDDHGRVCEKGPLFKIWKESLAQLFPNPKDYSLV